MADDEDKKSEDEGNTDTTAPGKLVFRQKAIKPPKTKSDKVKSGKTYGFLRDWGKDKEGDARILAKRNEKTGTGSVPSKTDFQEMAKKRLATGAKRK